MKFIEYITETKVYSANNSTSSNCNSLLFINTGTMSVTVDNVVLQPSQSWSIDGNYCEITNKVYYFNFPTDVSGVPQLTVVYKRYLG
jgi:hypothetical protein